MQTIKDILKKFKPTEDKYISREFQSFGVHLAQKLQDERRISLYIKLAKTLPRPVLEEALRFVVDSNARSKGALFMWKLKELGIIGQSKSKLVRTGQKLVKNSQKQDEGGGRRRSTVSRSKSKSGQENLF